MVKMNIKKIGQKVYKYYDIKRLLVLIEHIKMYFSSHILYIYIVLICLKELIQLKK